MTTGLVEAWTDVLAFVKNVWDNDSVTQDVPVAWPNLNTNTPLATGNIPWARIDVLFDENYQSGLGDSRRRYTMPGYLTVQIFTPVGQGKLLALGIAQVVIRGVRGQRTTNGVIFRDSRTTENEKSITGNWYQYNVTFNLEVDDIQ